MAASIAVRISYGSAQAGPGAPDVALAEGTPLRLSHGPYPFAEPPDLIGNATIEARLALLRDHLATQCGPWDKPARSFLDAYFAHIAAAIADNSKAIAALSARSGGLFAPADWSFSALRPLPQAHVRPDGGASVRADVAFWTGARIVAIELLGSASPRRQRQDELARLASAGVAIVRLPAAELLRDGAPFLARVLPMEFQRFWDGVILPASPFGADALGESLDCLH
ncbi:MAG TPA: hypothetical protein VL993_08185 [Stellaceae bacterium]|nr:hypothetical protein [Stellaceae bacterium]